ncbi:cation:proton antiporter [Deltaproteobacteria bacterium OttesenSCG-928-K17]|nr:cation:proton antiporter [Deltaproteobacteria bacterium OttesenSCG-928-K17]
MHSYPLLELLAVGFVLALFFGLAAQRVGLSPIVGYLLAGFLAGPNFAYFPFVADAQLAAELSEAGVILLMFGVGLHFNLGDLNAVKGVAVPGAIVQSATATALGTLAAWTFGFSTGAGLVLGMGLAVASTVVLLRVLSDNHVLDTVHGHVAVGWLIVEDIFTVLILVLLPSVAAAMSAGQGVGVTSLFWALGLALVKLAAMWVLILVVGGKAVPWLLVRVAKTRSQELFTLTVLVVAFATAVGAAFVFDASMALGAFLGGMVVGKSTVSHQAGADLLPLKDAFSVLFFVSVGMLFEPAFILEHPGMVLTCFLIVIIAKPLTAMAVVSFLGYSVHTALTVATGLAQVGEFSFILAQAAEKLELIPTEIYSILVICCMASIVINPSLVRSVPAIEKRLAAHPRLWRVLSARADRKAMKGNQVEEAVLSAEEESAGRAVVVGYGPTGRRVCETLGGRGLAPVLIDMNVDTVNSLTAEGRHAVFGDSSKPEVLRAAGIEKARFLVVTIPDVSMTAATAAAAKELNPNIQILARTRFINDKDLLCGLGVAAVAFEEEAVADALARLVISNLDSAVPQMNGCELPAGGGA